MPKRSLGQHLGVWDRLLTSIERNADHEVLRHYQKVFHELKEAVEQAREAKKRQLQLRAAMGVLDPSAEIGRPAVPRGGSQ